MATFAGPHDFAIGSKPAQDAEFTANRTGAGSFRVGILGFRAAFGYDIFGFRPEAELSYRQVGPHRLRVQVLLPGWGRSPGCRTGGSQRQHRREVRHPVLLGATGSPISPYFGGGAGLGRVTLDSRTSARFPDGSDLREFPESHRFRFGGGRSALPIGSCPAA